VHALRRAQQKSRELLPRPAQRVHRIQTGTHQIAHRLVPGICNPDRGQLARPMQPRQTGGIPPIRLDPVARPLGDQRRRHDNAAVPTRRQLALDAVTARSCLVTQPQLHPSWPILRDSRCKAAAVWAMRP